MSIFKYRSYQKELLDGEDLSFNEIKVNLQELNVINKALGGHTTTLKGFSHFIKKSRSLTEPLQIVEVGCGGGDNLRVIKNKAAKLQIPVVLTGIDNNADCISYARALDENKGIHFIHSDYRCTRFDYQPHIIFSSLFCHHFTDKELIVMLQWMRQNSQLGFFINDLHRHPLAYYSIKLLTQLFSKSRLVKNDAPLSVKRGFKKAEWMQLFALAGITDFKCNWSWAFRWLLISYNHAETGRI